MCRRTMGGDCGRGGPGLGAGWSGDTTHRSAAPTPVDTTWWPERQESGVGLGLPTPVGCLLAQRGPPADHISISSPTDSWWGLPCLIPHEDDDGANGLKLKDSQAQEVSTHSSTPFRALLAQVLGGQAGSLGLAWPHHRFMCKCVLSGI